MAGFRRPVFFKGVYGNIDGMEQASRVVGGRLEFQSRSVPRSDHGNHGRGGLPAPDE